MTPTQIIVRHRKNYLMHVTAVTFSSAVVPLCLIWLSALAMALPPLLHWGHYIPEVSGIRLGRLYLTLLYVFL
jgi:hypothetical protein